MLIEGRNAVKEAVASGSVIERLYAADDIRGPEAQEILDAARKNGIKIEFCPKSKLDKLSTAGRHQGLMAKIEEFSYVQLSDICLQARESGGIFLLLLDGIMDPHNLGSILRVAEGAGVSGVVLPERRSAEVNETVVRVAAGASAHIKVAKTGNLNDCIRGLKEYGVTVLGVELGGGGLYDADLTGDIALVIGGEGSGMHRLTKELCDGIVTIPMRGKVNSLNASVACGVAVYEAVRQRCKGDR